MPKLISNSTLSKIFGSSFSKRRCFLDPKSTLFCVARNSSACLESNQGFPTFFSNSYNYTLSSLQQRPKSTVVVWDSSKKEKVKYSKDEEDSLKRFAYGFAKTVEADRQKLQEIDGHIRKVEQWASSQEGNDDVNECNNKSEYDICNEINSKEVHHHDRDFDVFGFMETSVSVESFKSPSIAHAATTATSSYSFPNKESEEDDMLEEYLRRNSNRMLDATTINNQGKTNIEQDNQDTSSRDSYVSVNWKKKDQVDKNKASNPAVSSMNIKFYPSIQNRFSKRRRKRWIIPQGPSFALKLNKSVNLDIDYHDTLVGLHANQTVDVLPTGARNFSVRSIGEDASAKNMFGHHVDLHGKLEEFDETSKYRQKNTMSKKKGRRTSEKESVADEETRKINKQRICQQLQEVHDLASGYGGGYSESVPELEAEYCQDINAKERYDHILLKQKQKRLKHAGFNIPPLSADKPITKFNLKVSYDWSKVENN